MVDLNTRQSDNFSQQLRKVLESEIRKHRSGGIPQVATIRLSALSADSTHATYTTCRHLEFKILGKHL